MYNKMYTQQKSIQKDLSIELENSFPWLYVMVMGIGIVLVFGIIAFFVRID